MKLEPRHVAALAFIANKETDDHDPPSRETLRELLAADLIAWDVIHKKTTLTTDGERELRKHLPDAPMAAGYKPNRERAGYLQARKVAEMPTSEFEKLGKKGQNDLYDRLGRETFGKKGKKS